MKTKPVFQDKLGSAGQPSTKSFADDAACTKEANKLIAEKRKKGYVDEGVTAANAAGAR